jgi:hypothetical protein
VEVTDESIERGWAESDAYLVACLARGFCAAGNDAEAEEDTAKETGAVVTGMNRFDSDLERPGARARLEPPRISMAVVSSGGAFDSLMGPEDDPATVGWPEEAFAAVGDASCTLVAVEGEGEGWPAAGVDEITSCLDASSSPPPDPSK